MIINQQQDSPFFLALHSSLGRVRNKKLSLNMPANVMWLPIFLAHSQGIDSVQT